LLQRNRAGVIPNECLENDHKRACLFARQSPINAAFLHFMSHFRCGFEGARM
jgi:hypothetical protein